MVVDSIRSLLTSARTPPIFSVEVAMTERTCPICDAPMGQMRRNALVCSPRCRAEKGRRNMVAKRIARVEELIDRVSRVSHELETALALYHAETEEGA